MAKERAGLVTGEDISSFRRELQGATKEVERLDRVLNQGSQGSRGGVFSARKVREYDQQLGRVGRSMRSMSTEYRRVVQEVRLLEREQRKMLETGQKISAQQKEQIANLKVMAQSQHQAITGDQGRLGTAGTGGTSGGIGGFIGGLAGGFAPLAMAAMVGRWTWGKIKQGEGTLMANQMARMESERLTGTDPRSSNWRERRRQIERYGRSLAYTTAETQKLYQASVRVGGVLPTHMAKQNLALLRGYNMDPGALFGYHSALRHSGGTLADPNRNLIRGLRMGGFARAFSSEFAQSITGLLQQTADSRARLPGYAIPGLMGFIGQQLGGGFRRSPMRSARLLGGLHGTIQAPGGGEAGQAFMLRAMGFGRGASYVKALERMEMGVTDPANLKRLLTQVKGEVGGGEEMQALALSRLSGGKIKIWQARRLLQMDTEKLSSRGIQQAMSRQGTDIAGEAAKSRTRTGLVRRKISVSEAEAATATAGQPARELTTKAYLQSLKSLTEAINALAKLLKGDVSGALKSVNKATGTTVGSLITMGPLVTLIRHVISEYRNSERAPVKRAGR